MRKKAGNQKKVIYKFVCPDCLTQFSIMRWNISDVPKCDYCNVPLEIVKAKEVRK